MKGVVPPKYGILVNNATSLTFNKPVRWNSLNGKFWFFGNNFK